MTRGEAKKLFSNLYEDEDGFVKIDVEKLVIDKIYDDFESQTCKNCKFYVNGREDTYTHCRKHSDPWDRGAMCNFNFGDGFGCNEFKMKEIK